MMNVPSFTARTISGAGRGKELGVPTINVDLADVPADLADGIYACTVIIDSNEFPGALHFGPRPVYDGSRSCEVHLIDATLDQAPAEITIHLKERLRDVRNFTSEKAMIAQIERDIADARGILGI